MTVAHRDQFVARVAANEPVCRDHWRLVLRLAAFPATAPGQFIQIACRDMAVNYSPEREAQWEEARPFDLTGKELMSPLAMLRRPFSLMGRRDLPGGGGVELQIMHRVVGVGTSWLSHMKPGDSLHILGPLGNCFEAPAGEDQVAVLVGGGVGIPPMIYLASKLAGRKAVAFCGALTRELLPLTVTGDALPPGPASVEPLYNIGEFARHGIPAVIATNDGSYGFHGLVTAPLQRYLDRWFGQGTAHRPVLYTCGPEPMMKAVAQVAAERGLECQVSVERAMACGMGTCQSCVIKVKRPVSNGDRNWVYKLACTDGPVFRGSDLLW